MATVKRSVLKRLVKECLVEILIEGLDDDSSVNQLAEATTRRRGARGSDDMQETIQKRKKMLRQKIVTEAPPAEKTADDFIGQMTNDPVMAQIFAETAKTTLPAMIAGDRKGKNPLASADGAARLVQENDPGDLFEGSSNWANLAFSSAKKAP